MAKFNPDVPQPNAPTYFSLSQPISEMRGDTSTGVALSGAGDILKSSLTAADTVVKSVIDQKIHEGADTNRDAYTGALEQAVGVPLDQRLGTVPDQVAPVTQVADNTLIPGTTAAPVPASLERAVGQPLQLTGQMAMSGSKGALGLYYNGNLALMAKDLRGQFPGYRDYIDRKIEQVTGENPANAYYKNLQAIIADSITNNKTDTTKGLDLLAHPEVQNMPGLDQARLNIMTGNIPGNLNPYVYAQMVTSKHRGIIADNNLKIAQREQEKYDRDLQAENTAKDVTDHAYAKINQRFFTIFGNDKLNYQQFDTLVSKLASGEITATPDDIIRIQQAAHYFESALYTDIMKDITTKADGATFSQAAILNRSAAGRAEQTVKDALTGVRLLTSQVDDKQFGLAGQTARHVQILTDKSKQNLLTSTNQNVRDYVMTVTGLKALGGDNAVTIMTKDAVAKNLPADLQAVTAGQKMQIGVGNISTNLTKAIQDLKKAGVGVGDGPVKQQERTSYEVLTNIVKVLPDPTIPNEIKANIVSGAYGPGNERLINEFKADSVDALGRHVKGQQSLFIKMTAQEQTDAIWKLKDDPRAADSWDHYKLWSQRTFAQLFARDMRTINNLGGNPYIHFSYNAEAARDKLSYTIDPEYFNKNARDTTYQRQYIAYLDRKIKYINSGLNSMAGIAAKEGADVNAQLVNLMSAEGMQPDRISGMGKIMGAVINSAPKPSEGEQKGIIGRTIDRLKNPPQIGPDVPGMIKKGIEKGIEGIGNAIASPAEGAESGIVRGANAAHVSDEWGNPFSHTFKTEHLAPITTQSGKKILVNKVSAQAFQGFLNELESTGYKINSIGGYALREKKGIGGISQHAFGNAIDINPGKNPWGSSKTDMPDNISKIAAKYGISWGGNWRGRKDPMHFEFMNKKQLAQQ